MSQHHGQCSIFTYRLTAEQAQQVNRRRTTPAAIAERIQMGEWPLGAQAHIGSPVSEGDAFPLIVVRLSLNDADPRILEVNGQVFLDGNDTLWVTSVREGNGAGTWSRPPSTPATPAPYTPPPELVTAAERALSLATPEQLQRAEALYTAYGSVTGHRSAVTGAELPPFSECKPLVRVGWLAAASV